MVWAVIGGFALIGLLDLLPLIRRKKWRAVAAFICLFVIGLTLEILAVLHIKVPSVMYGWEGLIRWLGMGYSP